MPLTLFDKILIPETMTEKTLWVNIRVQEASFIH